MNADALSIWKAAESFGTAQVFFAASLADTGLAWPNGTGTPDPSNDPWELALTQAPMLTLEAVAVELYLKALHVKSFGEAPRGHDTGKLFDDLPPEVQNAIQEVYDHFILGHPNAEQVGTPNDVGYAFRELSHAVTDFRYHYDRTDRVVERV